MLLKKKQKVILAFLLKMGKSGFILDLHTMLNHKPSTEKDCSNAFFFGSL